MKNLLIFFAKYNFFFLFVLLEVICVFLISQNNSYQSSSILNTANGISGNFYTALANTKEYLDLKGENDKLMLQNAMLMQRLKETYDVIPLNESKISDTLYRQKYSYITGKVINNSTNRRSNYITLNIGKRQGVMEGMGVFCPMGVVGVVKATSENFSSCMSFLHKDVMFNCKLKRDGTFGPLRWEGDDYRFAYMYDIPTHARIVSGDSVITSSLSGLFPEGIHVGTIHEYGRRAGEATYTLKIKLSTDFKKINHVFVLKDIYKPERDSLESNSEKEPK
jgi:rod shape-determining protein MreC